MTHFLYLIKRVFPFSIICDMDGGDAWWNPYPKFSYDLMF